MRFMLLVSAALAAAPSLPAQSPDPRAVRMDSVFSAIDRTGSPELGATWTVVLKDSSLAATVAGGRQVTWHPAFKDGFTAEGNTVELWRDGRGRVTALLVTPGRSRNIRFERVR